MAYLLGRWPVGVSAHGARFAQPRYDDLVFLVLRFPGGVLGHVHLSWLDPLKVRRVSVVGEQKMAVFDDMQREMPLTLHPLASKPGGVAAPSGVIPHRPAMALTQELRAFVRSVRTGEAPLTPGEDGVRVAKVLDAAERSLRDGGREVSVRIR
jgi:predicted dehydrogenase